MISFLIIVISCCKSLTIIFLGFFLLNLSKVSYIYIYIYKEKLRYSILNTPYKIDPLVHLSLQTTFSSLPFFFFFFPEIAIGFSHEKTLHPNLSKLLSHPAPPNSLSLSFLTHFLRFVG